MSLFNRPAWSKAQASEADESGTNIFSHSRSYRDIVADKERRKREKLERKKAKEERRSSGKHKIEDEACEDSSSKRRRISGKESEALLNSVGLGPGPSLDTDGEDEEEELLKVVRRSSRINRHVNREEPGTAKKRTRSAEVIDVGDSDRDDYVVYTAPPPQLEEIEDESDAEFAELARRARQQRQLNERHTKSATPDMAVRSPSAGGGAAATNHRLPTPPPDPTIQIFISSRIPNTNPLIVHRKLSQNIQDIRRVWCQKQGFSEELTKEVFFIHRLRRVYDVTTCRSLGLDVDAFGNVTMKGAEGKEGVEKVHLEAVTDEIFKQLKAEQERETQRRSGELPPAESVEAGVRGAAAQKGDSFIRLVLKAKGKDDFKLKVKPTTPFAKIISAYCKTKLSDGQSARLEFDGEQLDPDDEVQSTEVTDMDCIDVHIQ